MSWLVSLPVVIILAGGCVASLVAWLAWRAGEDPLARSLCVVMIAIVAWAIPDAIGMLRADPTWLIFWAKVAYPGVLLAPIAYLVFALHYAGQEHWSSRYVIAGLLILPGISLMLVATEPVHGLFWAEVDIAVYYGAATLVPTYGFWYWIHLGYLYLVTLTAMGIFAYAVFSLGPIYRKQALLLFVAGLLPLTTNVATVAGILPGAELDLTSAALAGSGLLTLLALYHFDLLTISPVARHRLVEHLEDGMIVVDKSGRIRDFNRTAAEIFEGITRDQSIDAFVDQTVATDGGELTVEMPDGQRIYQTRSTPLLDGRKRRSGTILYLSDMTEIVSREQRLSVFNRVLRHNIRNELTVLDGYLTEVEAEDGEDELIEARSSVRQINDVTEKARELERALRDGDQQIANPTALVHDTIATARRRYSDVDIAFDQRVDSCPSVLANGRLISLALSELIENALEHANDGDAGVVVRLERRGDYLGFDVIDSGPGIPDEEVAVLTERVETHLEHGSGLGLWIARWAADHSGGHLTFDTAATGGTIASLDVPIDAP